MKPASANENRGKGSSPWNACKALCRKIQAQVTGVKEAIFAESSRAFSAPERLVRLALNEAEAAAFQTEYPHLFFPTLAMEKIQEVADWNAHQQSVRQTRPEIALVA
jgi:hypothetical protein